jgi:hypothetical protein
LSCVYHQVWLLYKGNFLRTIDGTKEMENHGDKKQTNWIVINKDAYSFVTSKLGYLDEHPKASIK